MTSSVASTLAQIIPVLFLTLLFEVRVRPAVEQRSKLGIVLGFLGNLIVAFGAIALEFGLLGIAQRGPMLDGADWVWRGCFVLFAIVLIRWMATTTATKILASTSALLRDNAMQSIATNEVLLTYVETVKKSPIALATQILIAPSQVLAEAFATTAVIFAETAREIAALLLSIGRQVTAIFGSRRR